MNLRKVTILVFSLIIPLLFFSFSEGREKRSETGDKFLDSLMDTESISDPYYEHYDISPDGKWVAFTIARSFQKDDIYPLGDLRKLPGGIPATFLRQDIWIASTKTGKLARITDGKPEKRSFWHPVWAPNSKDLVFYGDKNGHIVPWICRNAQLPDAKPEFVEGVRLKSSLFRMDIPRWTREGKKVIVPLLPIGEANIKPGIDDNPLFLIPNIYKRFLDPEGGATSSVLRSNDKSDTSRFLIAENRIDLGILDISSGKIGRLTENKDVMFWELSPDGNILAYKAYKKLIPGTFTRIFDLHIMPSEGGLSRLLLEDVEDKILRSPASSHLLERQKEELYTVDIQGTKRIITPSEDKTFVKVFPPPDVLQASTGSYIWSPDGKHVLAQNKEGWWTLSLDGTPPKRIFEKKEEKSKEKISGILRVKGTGYAYSPDGKSVILESFDPSTSRKNLLWADIKNDLRQPISGSVPNYTAIFELFRSKNGNSILYSQREMEVNNLWFSGFSFAQPIRFTDLNPHLRQIPRGKKTLFSYRNLDGQELKGALLYPPGYEEGKRYPLVVNVYAGSMVTALERTFPLFFNTVSCLSQLLSQCGYVVMQPSIPLSPDGNKGSPLKEIPDSVLPAVDKVVEMGIADPESIGVIGQSYGGYAVHVLITQTRRFKAAVSLAGLSDLISNYGIFDARSRYSYGGSSFFSSRSEGGQGRMGVPIWEDRLQWIENSPIYYQG
ncbi:MAG: prolyl oligopeptidase family serine peptidase [Candidatus Aminicenantes bacterium]|nr:MAG: prolyl oligopeptidase family serine peptidase [Candidatus Aminicenantes bacterium]